MGWKSALQYVRDAAEKTGFSAASQQVSLPLGGHLGATVQLEKVPFIQAVSSGSFIDMPVAAQNKILAISRVDLPIAGNVYRYYLALPGDGKRETFLQIYSAPNGDVADIMYCTQLTRMVPDTQEEQALFTGASGCGLGEQSYCLWRDQLAELGYGDADLRAAFGSAESIEYWRDAGEPEQQFIQPFSGAEMCLAGELASSPHIYYMPYRRQLRGASDASEFLFITTHVSANHFGDDDTAEVYADLVVGIAITLEHISIQ